MENSSLAQWIAQHPILAKAVGWTVILTFVGLGGYNLWQTIQQGKLLGLFVSAPVIALSIWRAHRAAQRRSASEFR